MTNETEMRVKS